MTSEAPSTSANTLYEAWTGPFLADPFDEVAVAARTAQTRELSALLRALPLGTRVGDLSVASAGWDAGHWAALQRSEAKPDHSWVILTADSREIADGWCQCQPATSVTRSVRYERWTEEGRAAHGFVCPDCRRLTQSG